VGDLDGNTSGAGQNWKALVTVAVHNDGHTPVSNATVTGTFSTGGSGSCVTSGAGMCILTSGPIKKSGSTTFTVTGVTGGSLTYTLPNHDVDGGTDGTSITIKK